MNSQMEQGPRFRHFVSPGPSVSVTLDGQALELPFGVMLAAALLDRGIATFGVSVTKGEPRGPLCLMGTCLQCNVLVDGIPMRACRVAVRDGLVIERRLDPLPPSPREVPRG
ncbi:(2Fe-2S)-binding protein [Desertibaculum subflavum]|uniref:(2Fe-2S)-binding protein n=1 Tax=Desertibaculum subflavum TaxID=2268458 RepID=UPI000E6679A4